MERNNNPVRNWKYVHHARKVSEDSINASFDSNLSSSSAKFNRFHFNRADDSSVSKRQQIFAFTGKGKDKNQQHSVLSKRSNKQSDTSKISEGQMILGGINRIVVKQHNVVKTPRHFGKSIQVKVLLKQVKSIVQNFNKMIQYFGRKFKEMQTDWNKSFQQLLIQQVGLQNQSMKVVKNQLQLRQKEIQQLKKIQIEKAVYSEMSPIKREESRTHEEREHPLAKLEISKVQKVRQMFQNKKLSRNDTIKSLLGHDNHPITSERGGGRQLINLRQTIKRMRQVLEE